MAKTVKLNDGRLMPLIGLGTYLIKDKDIIMKVVDAALAAGYRAIDTAQIYENEQFVGEALEKYLPKYNLKREDVFIASKLWCSNFGDKAPASIEQSLKNLRTDYLDLFITHYPGDFSLSPSDPKNKILRDASWRHMEAFHKDGRLKSIGVSNYTIKHLEEMVARKGGIIPAVNQVEFHPYLYQKDLLDYCKKHNIQLEAYSSLGGTEKGKNLMSDPTVVQVAKNLGKSEAQVLLKWALQHGCIILPKSVNPQRVKQNFELNFEIPSKDMAALDGLNKNKPFMWDPRAVV